MTTTQPRLKVHIRWMIQRDLPVVLDIEEQCFESPWSEDDLIRCLRQRNCIGMVAVRDDRVVGFMIYELHKTRLHILNFAVTKTKQRQAVGTQMAGRLIKKLRWQGRTHILLEVSETNLPAQQFFRKMGFRALSVLRDFYPNSEQDAYLFQYHIRQRGQNAESLASKGETDERRRDI